MSRRRERDVDPVDDFIPAIAPYTSSGGSESKPLPPISRAEMEAILYPVDIELQNRMILRMLQRVIMAQERIAATLEEDGNNLATSTHMRRRGFMRRY